ncbi:MAG: bilirubin oxidase [Acidobacteria bacterium]|nr:MAG: bilirubin oxidase [Acidobacteriota bacterium]
MQLKSGVVTRMAMSQFKQKLHRDLPPTLVWGFQGSYPGPTLEARQGWPVQVQWVNNLPTSHFLPIDNTIHGAESSQPEVRTVVHLHGHKILPGNDGYPEAWFTSDGKTGPDFNPNPYVYPNDQPATTLWYHDHGLGITRLNNYAGLSGIYLIRSAQEDLLGLPQRPYEIPLVLQDRMFHADGSLLYPVAVGGTHPCWIPEFFGDTVLVNGKVWPYLDVEPRKYRFRMLNASNARFYHLTLQECNDTGTPNGNSGPPIFQIGTDGGLLPAPVKLDNFLIAVAERFDFVIDFSGAQGKFFVLQNDAPAPYPSGGEVVPSDVMMFRVIPPLTGRDTSSLPAKLADIPLYDPAQASRERNLAITEIDRPSDEFPEIGMLDQAHWSDAVTENPEVGALEMWNLVNATDDAHPIHVHLVLFQALERRPFDKLTFLSSRDLVFTGPPVPPDANERPAWKDTIKAYPGMITRILAKFDLPTGTSVTPGQRFRYVWHCHMLEHEDNEMMRPLDVVAAAS